MRQRIFRAVTFSVVGSALIAGCAGIPEKSAGCTPDYVPRQNQASAVALANRALEKAGYDISHLKPSDIEVQYDSSDCSWAIFYTLYRDSLPAGPLLIVYDKSGRVGFTP